MPKLRAIVEIEVCEKSPIKEKHVVDCVKRQLSEFAAPIEIVKPTLHMGGIDRVAKVRSYERVRRAEVSTLAAGYIARIAELEKALKANMRLHRPTLMTLAETALPDGYSIGDTAVVYEYNGSSGSERVTYKQFKEANEMGHKALYGNADNVSNEEGKQNG
jgi:hypothetical protein